MAKPMEATQNEFANLSKLQLDKHTMETGDGEIESIFAGAVLKRTWYSTFPYKLESNVQERKMTFSVFHEPDYLAHAYLTQKLPAMKVKDKFKEIIRIAWPHNCGNNITPKGEFVLGSSNVIQTIDSEWMDDNQQMMLNNGYEQFVQECQGNFPFLEEWNTFLPEYTLTPVQPFFIDSDTESAFPIYRIESKVEITLKYQVRRNFRDLLRMQKYIKGIWKDIPFNKSYIEGNFSKDELPLPEMWGIFYKISKAEVESILEATPDEEDYVDSYEQIINEVVSHNNKECHTYGDTADIELHSAHPCKFITVKALNSKFEDCRNYSNYTTDPDVYRGSSPIKGFPQLKYGPTIKIEDLASHHTSRMLPFYHCPRVPYEKGYNMIPFSCRVAEYNFDVGVILSNLKVVLNVELGNTDPMITRVNIYKEGEDIEDVPIEEEYDDLNDENGPNAQDVPIEDVKKERINLENKNNPRYKLIVRSIISKTLVYKRIEGSKYFDVYFRNHEESK